MFYYSGIDLQCTQNAIAMLFRCGVQTTLVRIHERNDTCVPFRLAGVGIPCS
jgi:hypothetical protein